MRLCVRCEGREYILSHFRIKSLAQLLAEGRKHMCGSCEEREHIFWCPLLVSCGEKRRAVCYCVVRGVVVQCRVLQRLAERCSVVQRVAVCCSVPPGVAVCCSVASSGVKCCSVLQYVAVCCSVLQCVAVCCSVLQCVAVCCSVLQCEVVRGEVSSTFV